ncbi:MAG: hypothetical protein AAF939_08750 [Planctomycetota bacterium]
MFRIFAAALMAATLVFATGTDVKAQSFVNGYQFGTGVNASCFGNGLNGFNAFGPVYRGLTTRQAPPYFAQFPPVYYSGIVKRPYGISPFAVPAGITPVEMNQPTPVPVSIKNPHFKRKTTPAKVESVPVPVKNKMTVIANPFYEGYVAK